MAVKIRLKRRGRKRKPIYDVVVADSRAPRSGRIIEKLGSYNPNIEPSIINIDNDKALHWVLTGAQPTDTARKLLSVEGVMLRKHLQVGVNKGAITQDVADERYQAWLSEKQQKNDTRLSDEEKAKNEKLQKQAEERAAIQAEIIKKAEEAKKAEEEALIAAAREAEAAIAEAEGGEAAEESEEADAASDQGEAPAEETAQ